MLAENCTVTEEADLKSVDKTERNGGPKVLPVCDNLSGNRTKQIANRHQMVAVLLCEDREVAIWPTG